MLVSAERYSVQKKDGGVGGVGTWTRAYPTHLVMVYLSPDHRVVLDGNLNFLATNSLHELPPLFLPPPVLLYFPTPLQCSEL